MRLVKLMAGLLPALDLLLPPLPAASRFHPATIAEVELRGRIMSLPVSDVRKRRRKPRCVGGRDENKEIGELR